MRSSSSLRSCGVRSRSKPSTSERTIACSFSSSERRTASVGCAVNTGSIHSSIQPAKQLVGADALRLQLPQHIEQGLGLRRAALALVIAAAADAMHPLGRVDRLEIGGERPRQRLGMPGIETGQRIGQFGHRGSFAAAPDRRDAHLLDPIEKRRAALLGQHPADHRAKPADVLAQRAVVRQEFGFAAVASIQMLPCWSSLQRNRIAATEASREQA